MNFPTTWDETKLINGYPGEIGVIARRNGNNETIYDTILWKVLVKGQLGVAAILRSGF